jgi:hypothetical protein
MVFDEGDLFAASNEGSGEVLDLDEWRAMYADTTSSGSTKESINKEATKRKRRHRRERSLQKPPVASSKTSKSAEKEESFDDLMAALASGTDNVKNSDMEAQAGALDPFEVLSEKWESPSEKEKTAISSNFKIDSKSEFSEQPLGRLSRIDYAVIGCKRQHSGKEYDSGIWWCQRSKQPKEMDDGTFKIRLGHDSRRCWPWFQ